MKFQNRGHRFFFLFVRPKKYSFLEKYSLAKCIRLKKRITKNEYIFENEYFSKRILFMTVRETNICLTNTLCSKTNRTQPNLEAYASLGNTIYWILVNLKTNTLLTNTFFEKRILSLRILFGKRITCDRILLSFSAKNEYFENSKNE